jgi:hypothetical protein
LFTSISRGLSYWFRATINPGEVFQELRAEPHKKSVGFRIIFIFGLLYTITPLLLQVAGIRPAIPPWMPVRTERYYIYQPLWTIPWGLVIWIMIAGMCHLLATDGREGVAGGQFEGALAVFAVAWVVPSFYFMWIPETFIAPLLGRDAFPMWLEMLRLMVLPVIWQVYLVALGLRITYCTIWLKGIAIGLLSYVVFFIMFLAFMR